MGSMVRLGAFYRVGDLVQHGVSGPLISVLQGRGAAKPDHVVPKIAVAEVPPGLDEGEGLIRKLTVIY